MEETCKVMSVLFIVYAQNFIVPGWIHFFNWIGLRQAKIGKLWFWNFMEKKKKSNLCNDLIWSIGSYSFLKHLQYKTYTCDIFPDTSTQSNLFTSEPQ